jgi:hypothetical protein
MSYHKYSLFSIVLEELGTEEVAIGGGIIAGNAYAHAFYEFLTWTAAIIIASIVLLAACVVGGKKSYDMWKARTVPSGAVLDNPLYDASGAETFNPMYQDNLW